MNIIQHGQVKLLILCCVVFAIFVGIDWAIISLHSRNVPEKPPVLGYIPQFVLLSFDGSKDVLTWKETREFEREMNRDKKVLNFTYFINAAYFITPDKADLYEAPGRPRGESNIGFSEDLKNLRQRIEQVNAAIADGDEIASHAAGHFWGSSWTKEEWEKEFASFDDLLFGIARHYPDTSLPILNLAPTDIVGFRAPALSINPSLYSVLSERHFLYDSSEISHGKNDIWPTKDKDGIWRIPLGIVFLDNGVSPVVAMDYSIRMHKTPLGKLTKESPEWKTTYDDVLASYLRYFENNYKGNRAPVLIGHHFESWDDDLYFEVMKSFAREVCTKPEVRCGTFKELVSYMNDYGVPPLVK
jgi:hypothetical protein